MRWALGCGLGGARTAASAAHTTGHVLGGGSSCAGGSEQQPGKGLTTPKVCGHLAGRAVPLAVYWAALLQWCVSATAGKKAGTFIILRAGTVCSWIGEDSAARLLRSGVAS